jgi:hypothetical protein
MPFTLCVIIINLISDLNRVFECTFRLAVLLVAEPSLNLPFEPRAMPRWRQLSCLAGDVFLVALRGDKVSLVPGDLAMKQAAAHLSWVLHDLLIRLRRLVLGVRRSAFGSSLSLIGDPSIATPVWLTFPSPSSS